LKIMSRRIAADTALSPLASIEAAVRLTLKTLSGPASSDPALEMLEAEQSRIRASGRHWLLG
jgi:hypothetical protein